MDLSHLLTAFALVTLAFGLLVAEFFIVSFGLLLIGAIGSVIAGVYFAFMAHPGAGWAFVIAVPLVSTVVIRLCIHKVRESKVVPKAQIKSEAGYHHVADRIGVSVGASGQMVTAARPSGRARFSGGECDVQTRGRPLERGAEVRVTQIDGPIVFVEPSGNSPVSGAAKPVIGER